MKRITLVGLLLATQVQAACPPDPWDFYWPLVGNAKVKTSTGEVWVTLTPTRAMDGTFACKDECTVPIDSTVVNDAPGQFVPGFSLHRPCAANATPGFILGALWTGLGVGGSSGNYECGPSGMLQYNSGVATADAILEINKMFQTGVPVTLYLGKSTVGAFSTLACDGDTPCVGVGLGCDVTVYGYANRRVGWNCDVTLVSSAPGGCHPECPTFDKAQTQTQTRPWNAIKELYK